MSEQFDKWNKNKIELHHSGNRPVFREGDVWWCHLGTNIGVEMNGKGDSFTRPIVIIRKFNTFSFYGLPLTTKFQDNSDFYHVFEFNGRKQAASLSQLRLIDSKRLQRRMVDLPNEKFQAIKKALKGLL